MRTVSTGVGLCVLGVCVLSAAALSSPRLGNTAVLLGVLVRGRRACPEPQRRRFPIGRSHLRARGLVSQVMIYWLKERRQPKDSAPHAIPFSRGSPVIQSPFLRLVVNINFHTVLTGRVSSMYTKMGCWSIYSADRGDISRFWKAVLLNKVAWLKRMYCRQTPKGKYPHPRFAYTTQANWSHGANDLGLLTEAEQSTD